GRVRPNRSHRGPPDRRLALRVAIYETRPSLSQRISSELHDLVEDRRGEDGGTKGFRTLHEPLPPLLPLRLGELVRVLRLLQAGEGLRVDVADRLGEAIRGLGAAPQHSFIKLRWQRRGGG